MSDDSGIEQPPGAGERAPRPPWSEFKAALDAVGFRPSRRLGQNLLLDENTARWIAQEARVGEGELVLEVGPGSGFLSVHLAHAGARLLAVEIDQRLATLAREFLAPYPDAEVLVQDVLAGKNTLAPQVVERLPSTGDWHLVSNLPYSVGGPVLALLAGLDWPPASMTFLVQLEVGERLAAGPGTSDWGPLTIAVQGAYEVRILRRVGRDLFWPRPRVESAVVRAERRSELAPPGERAALRDLARGLFHRRRQGVARVLGDLLGDREAARGALAELGIDPMARAETLSLERLWALARSGAWGGRPGS